MGEVRDRMEQDLFLRGVAANTRETYLRYAKQFVAFHRRDPRQLDTEEVRAWVMHLRRAGRAPRSINVALSALRFLFGVTLRRPEVMHPIRRVVEQDKQPAILSGSEVQRLLDAIERPRDRALVMLLYGSGLRISEALSLTTADVDSGRGVLTIRHTKGEPGTRQRIRRRGIHEVAGHGFPLGQRLFGDYQRRRRGAACEERQAEKRQGRAEPWEVMSHRHWLVMGVYPRTTCPPSPPRDTGLVDCAP